MVPTGGGGASCVLCTGLTMAVLVGVYVDVGLGASKLRGIGTRGRRRLQIQHRQRFPLGEWIRVKQRNDNYRQQEERLQGQRSNCRPGISS